MVAIHSCHIVPIMTPGTNSMLRARRKDKDVRPNRLLDRTASRGMLYENEELRLRTININADLEKGQQYIKKLRRENSQLRREIWSLRDQYDKLESMMRNQEQDQGSGEDQDEYDEELKRETEETETLSIVEEENEIEDSIDNDESNVPGNMENCDKQMLEVNQVMSQFASFGTVTEEERSQLNLLSENEISAGKKYKMCSLKTCEDFVNVFRKNAEEHPSFVFSIDGFDNLTVQEVIDHLEDQLKDECRNIVKGIRLTIWNCFITIKSIEQCEALLNSGLKLRNGSVKLDNVWEKSTILLLSAVPHYVLDEQIVSAISRFADVIGNVEKQTYKGLDTGERFAHIKTPDIIPYQLLLGSICIPVTIIFPNFEERPSIARRKSFRSEININLKQPEPHSIENCDKVIETPSNCNIQETNAIKSEPSFFSKSTGIILTPANSENNVFEFPTCASQSSVQNSSKKKSNTMSLGLNSTREIKNFSESPSSFRKFAQKRVNSVRKINADTSDPPSPIQNSSKLGRKPSVNFRNGPGESLLKSRTTDSCLNDFGSVYMRERSTSDASSGRISICRRKLSVTGHENSPKIPWCGCWGIGCC